MKQPVPWIAWLLGTLGILVVAEFGAITWLVPRYVVHLIRASTNGAVTVGRARLIFPFTVTLEGVRWTHNSGDAALAVQQVVLEPRWVSWRTKTIHFRSITVHGPLVRVTRTEAGTFVWPTVPLPILAHPAPGWHAQVDTVRLERGSLELVDRQSASLFHGAVDHLTVVLGPLALPLVPQETSFAIHAQLVGHAGHAAPFYCSGWVGLSARDLSAACRLEPLALAAFEPYYQGPRGVKVRVYQATFTSTSKWTAKSNAFEGRLQVEVENLTEGDLSVHGRTVVDVRTVMGEEPRLKGEVTFAGPLDRPHEWVSQFVPGDARVEELMAPVFERGISMIRVPVPGGTIGVTLTTSASEETTATMEQATEDVKEELEVLAPASPAPAATEAAAPPAQEPPAQPPVEPPPIPPASNEPTPPAASGTDGLGAPSSKPVPPEPPPDTAPPRSVPPPKASGPAGS